MEFNDLYKSVGFYRNIEYLKVLKYKDEEAHVYSFNKKIRDEIENISGNEALILYIEEGHSSASLFIFAERNKQWELVKWNTLWAHSGSADSFFWPFYP